MSGSRRIGRWTLAGFFLATSGSRLRPPRRTRRIAPTDRRVAGRGRATPRLKRSPEFLAPILTTARATTPAGSPNLKNQPPVSNANSHPLATIASKPPAPSTASNAGSNRPRPVEER